MIKTNKVLTVVDGCVLVMPVWRCLCQLLEPVMCQWHLFAQVMRKERNDIMVSCHANIDGVC